MNINQPSENIVIPFVSKPKKINLQDAGQVHEHRRLWIVKAMPQRLRNEVVAGLGELVGTFMFLFFAFSATQVANFVAPGDQTASSSCVPLPQVSPVLSHRSGALQKLNPFGCCNDHDIADFESWDLHADHCYRPNTSNLLFISLAFGFSLAVNAWVFFRISGGLFNPAVSSSAPNPQ